MAKKKPTSKKKHFVCSFCGQDERTAKHVVAASNANICDVCLVECIQLIFEHAQIKLRKS